MGVNPPQVRPWPRMMPPTELRCLWRRPIRPATDTSAFLEAALTALGIPGNSEASLLLRWSSQVYRSLGPKILKLIRRRGTP
jgi:hypothetical protein